MNEPMQPSIVADYERIAEDQMAECEVCEQEYHRDQLSFPFDSLFGDTGERWCEMCQEDERERRYERQFG